MALTSFALSNFVVNHTVDYPDIVCVENGDSMLIVLATNASGQKYVSQLTLTPANSLNTTYADVWANALHVAYNPSYDQITGVIHAPDLADPEGEGYTPRNFCMSLQGTPGSRSNHLHVYVGTAITGGGGDPDDGSWTGDTPQ